MTKLNMQVTLASNGVWLLELDSSGNCDMSPAAGDQLSGVLGSLTVYAVPDSVDVLHVVPAYYPNRGGIEVLIENLTEKVKESYGITSAVLVEAETGRSHEEFLHRGSRVYSVSTMPVLESAHRLTAGSHGNSEQAVTAFAGLFARIRRTFRETSPRLVHVHTWTVASRAAMAIAESENIPVLMHVHEVVHLHGLLAPDILAEYQRRLRKAPWVCAVSDAVRDSLRNDCARNLPIHVIRNGVADPVSRVRPWRPQSPSVCMVGRLVGEKGFDDGLRALAAVREKFPDLRIRFVGTGPLGAELHGLAVELGVVDCVEYLGELSNEAAVDVIAGCDVSLIPSNAIEGFSIAAIEAALVKTPVVATAVGGLPESVIDKVTGLLVPPRDVPAMIRALESLLLAEETRRTMGDSARERARAMFSMDRFAEEVVRLYATIWSAGASVGNGKEADDQLLGRDARSS